MTWDSDITDATTDLLTEAGGSFVYIRGNQTATVTMRKSEQTPLQIDSGSGSILEVMSVDFILLTTSLPYAVPLQGDLIRGGGKTYRVQPVTGDKCYFQKSPTMTRIHTVQVK